MLAALRQARILEEVRRTGGARVATLTEILGVSDMTVRRDLDALDSRGLLIKVHGGATSIDNPTTTEPEFETKNLRQRDEKAAIAKRAAELVQPGMSLAISAGTTTWALAHRLTDVPDLTVVTNSIKVAEVLYAQARSDLTVVLTGGARTPSGGLVGPVAVQSMTSLHVDLAFMGVHGFDADAGLTTPNMLEAETNRAMVGSAHQLVVLADHTKWGVVGFAQIAPLTAVTTLVVDDGLPDDARETLGEHVGSLVLAPGASARRSPAPTDAADPDAAPAGAAGATTVAS